MSSEPLCLTLIGLFRPPHPQFAFAGDPVLFLRVSADSWISWGQSVCCVACTKDLGLAIVFILPGTPVMLGTCPFAFSSCLVQPEGFLLFFFSLFFLKG